jgi:hypothetical protein
MEFGLAKYLSNDLTNKSKIIQDYSERLSEFFKSKYYGDGLKDISVGIICVSPEFESFFKPRKPKFTKSKTVVIYGLRTVYDHVFECDVKLDYESFKKANNKEMLKIIATELVSILDVLKKKKIKDFDIDRFQQDLKKVV